MLISKDKFVRYVNRYAMCTKEQEMFQNALRPYFESPVCSYLETAMETLEEMLVTVSESQEEDDIFWWWAHEMDKDNCIIEVQNTENGDKTEYNVLTPEGLYDYLYDMYHHDD